MEATIPHTRPEDARILRNRLAAGTARHAQPSGAAREAAAAPERQPACRPDRPNAPGNGLPERERETATQAQAGPPANAPLSREERIARADEAMRVLQQTNQQVAAWRVDRRYLAQREQPQDQAGRNLAGQQRQLVTHAARVEPTNQYLSAEEYLELSCEELLEREAEVRKILPLLHPDFDSD